MLLWLSLAAVCCLCAHAQPQYGGPVQFGPPPSNSNRGPPQRSQSAFQAPRFAAQGQVFAAPQGFRPAPVHDNNDLGPSTPEPILLVTPPGTASTRSRPQPAPQQQQNFYSPAPQNFAPSPTPQARKPSSSSNRGSQRAPPSLLDEELDEEELEEQKPDRLTELLPHSKFQCAGKMTGYYADQDLACEVFHYCQDGAKHSWVCPDGFTFHQVHLICMPPSHDNICQKSNEFFFVNEYLYRPVNLEEHQRKPNISLRYSDRYFPENEYALNHEDEQESRPRPQPTPAARRQPTPAPRNQVFHSPETVNIPLQQRRPAPAAPAPTRQQFQEEEYDYDDFPYRQQG
ncbi:hypothetical protein B566_EDAN011596 [Ephemera danica]|nr:hypothetical protein B566_EDAN011596 [Ephemera danica]